MKKLASILLAALMVFSLTATASAHHHSGRVVESISAGCHAGWKNYTTVHHAHKNACSLFADADNDGICDNCNSKNCAGQGHHYADADNNGVCDNCGSKNCAGQGHHYADADNNGVCDNCNSKNCAGQGHHYADADNDGVCDNCSSANCSNSDAGQGSHHGSRSHGGRHGRHHG